MCSDVVFMVCMFEKFPGCLLQIVCLIAYSRDIIIFTIIVH